MGSFVASGGDFRAASRRAGGGWRNLANMKRSYQQADAATVLKVFENVPGGHIGNTPVAQVGAAE